jgi:hypothetical protein
LLLQLAGRRERARDGLERRWLKIRRRLARARVELRPGDTPLELAVRAAPSLSNGHELMTLASDYVDLRYGPVQTRTARERFEQQASAWRPRPEPG